MGNKYFYNRVKQMRLLYRKYLKTRDKYYLSLSNKIGNDIDEEIIRIDALVSMKSSMLYELMNINESQTKFGKEWYFEHIKESLDYFFCDRKDCKNLEEWIYPNGFDYQQDYPTLVINDMGDTDEDDMLEFRIIDNKDKCRLIFLNRLKG